MTREREPWFAASRVAALYVDPAGAYAGLPGVDVWDEARDARLYDGPWPVVAHPPCARWSLLAGLVEHVHGYKRGDDGGCFEAALTAVRRFGGVLEHPAYSAAWARFDLPRPAPEGWTATILSDGHAACVEQGRYGLPVKKLTWLYAVGVELPALRWGDTPEGVRWVDGRWIDGRGRKITATEGRQRGKAASATPPAFRDVLLAMARSASREPILAGAENSQAKPRP